MKTIIVAAFLSITFLSCKAQTPNLISEGEQLTLVSEDFDFTEGPATDAEGNVYFTDQPNDCILKWDATTNSVSKYLNPSGRSNGLYFDNSGNLISCADAKNELWKIDANKKTAVLIDNFDGKKLGGPNDLWIDANNGMYITDPFYKRDWWEHTEAEITERRVYYLAPNSKSLTIVGENFVQPNGIIGTADGKTLYIADIGDKKTYQYSTNSDGSLSNRKLFCELGSDGMTIDNLGNVYLTGDGVTVFNKNGIQISHIKVPEGWTANVTFGGPDRNILFITAMDSVYTLKMNVSGAF